MSNSTSNISETKKNHLWRKIVWHTDPEVFPLGPFHSAEVYCCEEANGYAVWYVRKLPKDGIHGVPGTENADYLLQYFGKQQRDAAIEKAVLLAHGDGDIERALRALDDLATKSQKV